MNNSWLSMADGHPDGADRFPYACDAGTPYMLHKQHRAEAQAPGRLRSPRDDMKARTTLSDAALAELFPLHSKARVIVTHTRPELLAGVLARGDP